jgi:hypothetical protein
MSSMALSNNPAWRGGKTVTPNGYVLVKQPTHPHADVRGYVYEHRLVAESKLGRYLLPTEQVHHIDGNKSNNDPRNLEVTSSIEHRRKHAKRDDLRPISGENPISVCACGCGEELPKYDDKNRPRKFVHGHNRRNQCTR